MKENNDAYRIRTLQLISPAILQGFAWPLGRWAVDFFAHLRILGKENLALAKKRRTKESVGTLFVINHTHELDFLFPLVALPPFSALFPMFYVAHSRKKYNEKKGFGIRRYIYSFPAFLTSWGAHPYIADQNDYSKSMPYHENLLRQGKSVCIFPEGRIQKEGVERKIRGGVAYLAEATNATIVPVAISNARGMSAQSFLKRKRHITVNYLPPLYAQDIVDSSLPVPERYKKSAEAIMDVIEKHLETNT